MKPGGWCLPVIPENSQKGGMFKTSFKVPILKWGEGKWYLKMDQGRK